MARMEVIEKAWRSASEVILAQTRTAGSAYYQINPSGRVPYLVRDDGVGMEESAESAPDLDQLDGSPPSACPRAKRDGRRAGSRAGRAA
jgi:glutathione S-transferase